MQSSSPQKSAPRKALRVVKPRAPARPHKKLASDVLTGRVADTKKRLQVLQSKAVLMEDRLDAYEKEVSTRAADSG